MRDHEKKLNMADTVGSRLTRRVDEMPGSIADALRDLGLEQAYAARPPYQRNDYIGWIVRAKREDTRLKRLRQMLSELQSGTHYMNMPYQTGRRTE